MMTQTKIVRSVFTVKDAKLITPHYKRVIFAMSNAQVKLFGDVKNGRNNKIFIPPPGVDTFDFPDDVESNVDVRLIRRTYTTRKIDLKKKEIWVDFVAHGDNGPASYWAQRAGVGSLLGIAMKVNDRPLFPAANEYLLIGDSTALPVISAILEQLPDGVNAHVIMEVYSPEDEITFVSKASVDITWVHNPHPELYSHLEGVVQFAELPGENRFAFIAAEYDTVKMLRKYFKELRGWKQEELSASAYWKRGEAEEQSAFERIAVK